MPSRAELVARANVLGIDTTTAKMANDSALEQRVLRNEKRATAVTGTIATTTLTSNGTAVSDGDTVTYTFVGRSGTTSRTYTAKTTLTELAASGTLTTSGVFSDGELVVVDGVTYIMRATLTTGAQCQNEVLIGVSASVSLDNLKTTINGTGQGSTTNTATYAHPTCTAGTKTSNTLVVSAKNVGTYGNRFATRTTAANATWGGSFMTGGAESVANEVLIGSTSDGSAFLSNLKKAINGSATAGTNYSTATPQSQHVVASTLTSTTLLVNSSEFAIGNGDIGTTTTAANLSWTSTVMASGAPKVIAAASSVDQISGDAETLY